MVPQPEIALRLVVMPVKAVNFDGKLLSLTVTNFLMTGYMQTQVLLRKMRPQATLSCR
jgi:hypothetical protein